MKRVVKASTDNVYYWNGVDDVPKDVVNVVIEDGVTNIEWSAFRGCTSLTSVTIPDSVTIIEDWAFYDCTGLKSIDIPDSVTSIRDNAFFGCTNLTSIIIPGSVKWIGPWAFCGCERLTSVTIGSNVKGIGYNAFFNCPNLRDVTILSDPDDFERIKDSIDWNDLNIKNIKAAPEIKQQVARMQRASNHTSYKDILSKLEEDLNKYADPLYEDTEAGSYITGLCQETEDQLSVRLEPSIQGGRGGIWIYDSNNNILAEDIDFENFDSDVIDIALQSKSPSDFKRKYTSYLKRLLK